MHIYLISILAYRTDQSPVHEPAYIKTSDGAEALRLASSYALRTFPEHLGWHNHSVSTRYTTLNASLIDVPIGVVLQN